MFHETESQCLRVHSQLVSLFLSFVGVLSTGVLSPGILSPGVLSPGVLSPGVLSP